MYNNVFFLQTMTIINASSPNRINEVHICQVQLTLTLIFFFINDHFSDKSFCVVARKQEQANKCKIDYVRINVVFRYGDNFCKAFA